MRAFSYLGARKLSLQVAAPPLAALMAEAALREHASSREVELTDAPEPQSIPPAPAETRSLNRGSSRNSFFT